MQVQVNKDLDSYKDDFFKGLTLRQSALSLIAISLGCLTYLFGTYILHLEAAVSFYLALPIVLPIAATGFLKIHGMTPLEYVKRRRGALKREKYVYLPEALLRKEMPREEKAEKREELYLNEIDQEVSKEWS